MRLGTHLTSLPMASARAAAARLPAFATWLALALLAWTLAAWSWRLLDPGAAGIAQPASPAQPARVLADRVAATALFGRAGGAVEVAGIAEDLLPAPANVILRGVYAPRRGAGGFAVLDIDGRAVSVLVGQEAAPGLMLEATRDDHVVLARGAERLRVALAAAAGAGDAASGVTPAFTLRLRQLGEGHYALSRAAFNEASKNPASYASFGRFALHPRGGAVLEHSTSDGLSQQLGLRVGDIVTHINQRPLRSADDAARLFSHIAGGERVVLAVLRQERPLTITIDMQP